MEYEKEEIANSVLEVIMGADKYINNADISKQLNVLTDEVNDAITRIRQYNELFLDVEGKTVNDGLVYVRVWEWIRHDVRKFLDNGGFISIQKELDKQHEFERKKRETHSLKPGVMQEKNKIFQRKT